jgi:ABC-2 type transport system permease protein
MSALIRRLAHLTAICWHYGVQRLKVDMSYRIDFWVNFLLNLANSVVQLFFIWALFYRVPDIQGWTFPAVVLIYGLGQLSFGYASIFCFDLVIGFSDYYVIEGNLDRPLVRPLPTLLQLMMENLRFRDAAVVLKGTAIIWWALANLDPPIAMTPGVLLAAHALAITGAVVYTGVFMFVTSFSFWFKDRIGFSSPLFSLSEAVRYPITIYHPAVQVVFSLVIPFGYCAFYPAVYFTDPAHWRGWLLAGPAVAAAALAAGVWMFNRGLRVYESTGS